MDLLTYSQGRIGQIWTGADHEHLAQYLAKVDRLVHDVYNLAKEAQCVPVSVRPAPEALTAGDRVVCRSGCRSNRERVIERFGVSTLDDGFIAYFVGGGSWPVDDLRRV